MAGRYHLLALTDGSDAGILNMVDDHSRLLAGCTACRVFTGRYRGRGRVALERELTALEIGFGYRRPHHPQTLGKVYGSTRPNGRSSRYAESD